MFPRIIRPSLASHRHGLGPEITFMLCLGRTFFIESREAATKATSRNRGARRSFGVVSSAVSFAGGSMRGLSDRHAEAGAVSDRLTTDTVGPSEDRARSRRLPGGGAQEYGPGLFRYPATPGQAVGQVRAKLDSGVIAPTSRSLRPRCTLPRCIVTTFRGLEITRSTRVT